jgi:hypothetical protein
MSEWWYYTIYKCAGCGAKWEEYDHTAPWYDSGLSSCPVISQECEECFAERHAADLARQTIEDAILHLADEYEYFPYNEAQAQAADILHNALESI